MLLNGIVLLLGGLVGAGVLTLLRVPAGALIGSVLGAMAVNKIRDSVSRGATTGASPRAARSLPRGIRVIGQVLLGVLAGARLDQDTLSTLIRSLLPVVAAVVLMLAASLVLARYLVRHRDVDPLTAVMAAAPGGISELAITAQQQGARMHVVLTVHLFRVLVVVLLVLPALLYLMRHT